MVTDLSTLTANLGIPLWLLITLTLWIGFWKALALWKSARLNQPIWFVILLIVNTLGILEILYLFLFSRISLPDVDYSKSSKKKKRK